MFKEKCWFLYGIQIGRFVIGFLKYDSQGEECFVEFDWKKGLAKFLIGWFHTHPTGVSLSPSSDDQKTMRSWVRTLEKPLVCGIMHENKKLKCYLFKRKTRSSTDIVYQYMTWDKLFKNFYIGVKQRSRQ